MGLYYQVIVIMSAIYLIMPGPKPRVEQVTISEFKATCLRLLDKVKKTGQPLLVTRRGEPIVIVTPPPPPQKPESWLGSMKDTVRIAGDIISPALNEKDWGVLKG